MKLGKVSYLVNFTDINDPTPNYRLIFIRQLSASRINIFSPAPAQPCIHPVFAQVIHKSLDLFFIRFFKFGKLNGIIFYDINQVGRYLSIDFDQFICIFEGIIEISEKDIFNFL